MSDGAKRGHFRRNADPARVAEFAAVARRLQVERETSANVVDRLLRETPRERWRELADRSDFRTSGALERLGNTVARTLDRDPREALALAELAVACADAVPAGIYPPVVVTQLRAHASKDLGQALANLARYGEALAALDRAERYVTAHCTLAHDLAIIRFARATTLQEMNRHDESLALLAEAKAVFREHHDQRRLVLCGIAEGVLLHRLRKYREARETYLLLLAGMPDWIDREAAACLHNVIGHCSVDLGDYESAELHLSRAIELFHELRQPMRAAKAQLGRGRMLVRKGQIHRGVAHLRLIRSDFLRNEMIEEAGLCGLEIAEAHLISGAADEAEALARQIVAEFAQAGLNARAVTAVAYLQQAIAERRASRTTVARVREYILSLRTSPEREFVPAI